ncbi:hypothetical protein K474DRAFT_1713044 [Panus rudis PR-1116 ss-1]|nr:hypothetical protein K474DRAFT_1713044 [Panus rudis PR-1116 ss-1]
MRTATICSGTESPLFALDLVRRGVLQHYPEFEHVYSCEIFAFKRAYIERHFQPPLLLRDVPELGNTYDTTAYAPKALVPRDVDVLIELHGRGEFARTFRGAMSWVQRHRPPIVLLEKLCSAPWKDVVNEWHKNKHSVQQLRVDEIPYPCAVEGYAVDGVDADISTLDAFLLPLMTLGFTRLARSLFVGRVERAGSVARTDIVGRVWRRNWVTSDPLQARTKLPDYAWQDWGVQQVERVWDSLDISLMRAASKNVDPSYKTQVWDSSQDVNRSTGSSKVGICPCLTPSMIPYITNRGGPMVGIEALSLQGLPVD